MVTQHVIGLSNLVAATLFILGLKRMASPVTALAGITVAGIGMIIAILASFFVIFDLSEESQAYLITNLSLGIIGLLFGGGWAWWRGKRVAMAEMPQMVALYNGMGGGAAAAIAAIGLSMQMHEKANLLLLIFTVVGAFIGSISLTGSIVAWAKLDGKISKPWRFDGQHLFDSAIFIITLLLGLMVIFWHETLIGVLCAVLFFISAFIFGVLVTTNRWR